MSSPTPTLSPTASNDDDNDEDGPRFGGTPLIVGGVVLGSIILFTILVYIKTRPSSKPLKSGDTVIWKKKGLKGEVIDFDMQMGKFEVHFFATSRHEFLDPTEICRPGEGAVEMAESDIELGARTSNSNSRSRGEAESKHSHHHNHHHHHDKEGDKDQKKHKGKNGDKDGDSNEKKHKGHFREDGTWDPEDGTKHHHHESHLHTILNAKDAQGELAEALGISATKEKMKLDAKRNASSKSPSRRASDGSTHALTVEKRRSMMNVGTRDDHSGSRDRGTHHRHSTGTSPHRGRSPKPNQQDNRSLPRNGSNHSLPRNGSDKSLPRTSSDKSLPRTASDKSLPRTASDKSLPRVGSRNKLSGNRDSVGDGSGSRTRGESSSLPREKSLLRDRSQQHIHDHRSTSPGPDHKKGAVAPKRASKSTSPPRDRSRDGRQEKQLPRPDSKRELKKIFSGEVEDFLDEDEIKGKGSKL